MKPITIAIDGHSSCGKSTMAKTLAKRLGYKYIDSGAMYRAVTLYGLKNGIITTNGAIDLVRLEQEIRSIRIGFVFNHELEQSETHLNGGKVEKEIRTLYVSNHVSKVAAIPFVRRAMVAQQQQLGKEKSIVMDGRDVGSVVFPDAEFKVFITALPEVRAQRRMDELLAKGEKPTFEEVLNNLIMRDQIDEQRQDSPLRRCDDALILDNSSLSIEQQNEWLYNEAIKRIEHV